MNRSLRNLRGSRGRRSLLVLSLVLLPVLASCDFDGCNDDYNPTDPKSCSYDREVVEMAEARNASVGAGQSSGRIDGEVFLFISPPEVAPDEPPTMTMYNAGDTQITFGHSYRLTKIGSDQARDLAKRCVFTRELLVVAPGEESEPQEIHSCSVNLRTGTYEVDRDVTFQPGPEEEVVTVGALFKVAP
jgi:hypothetical protein